MAGCNIEEIEIVEPLKEVTEEFYNQHKDSLPATFELDKDDNIINITSLPKLELIIPESTIDDYLLDLDFRISSIELGL